MKNNNGLRLALMISAFSILIVKVSFSQTFSHSIHTGLHTAILDESVGSHIAYNPSFSFTNYLSADLYSSYAYTKISGSFISGKKMINHTLLFAAGPRFYILNSEKKYPLYLHLLVGAFFQNSKDEFNEQTRDNGLAFHSGIGIEIRKVVAGIYASSPDQVGIKIGYVF